MIIFRTSPFKADSTLTNKNAPSEFLQTASYCSNTIRNACVLLQSAQAGHRSTIMSQMLFSWLSPRIFSISRIGGLTDSFRRATGFQVPLLRVREFPFGARRWITQAEELRARRGWRKRPRACLNLCVDCRFMILRQVGWVKDLRVDSQCLLVAVWWAQQLTGEAVLQLITLNHHSVMSEKRC